MYLIIPKSFSKSSSLKTLKRFISHIGKLENLIYTTPTRTEESMLFISLKRSANESANNTLIEKACIAIN